MGPWPVSCRLRDEQPEPKEERLREVTVNVQVNGTGQVPVRRLVGIDLGIASEHTVRVLDGAGNKVCAARCVSAAGLCFMQVTDPKTVKNRLHLDLTSSAQGPGPSWPAPGETSSA